MMVRKLLYLVSFVLMLSLVSSASAALTQWTGATSRDWMDPTNWTNGVPAVGVQDNTLINGVAYPGLGPIISAGQNASTATGDTWGPEWGIGIEIQGGSYSGPAFVGIVAVGDAINPATIKLGEAGTGGSINLVNFLIGDSWWFSGGPVVTYSQWSGTCVANDYIWLGGKMNLLGGYTKATNGFNMAAAGQPSSLTTVTIDGGKLSLPKRYWSDGSIANWIAGGYLVAGPGEEIKVSLLEEPGRAVLTSTPEPTTLALLCFGGLALIRRKRN